MGEQIRAETAAALDELCEPGSVLAASGNRASFVLYANDARRRRTKDAIVDAYLAEQNDVERGGRLAVVATAGVPAAGKSTAIEYRGLAGKGWRVLDADRIKDYLIEDALTCGIYDDLLEIELPDGGPVRPRELVTLVHRESTEVLDRVKERCVQAGENLVIEGTFRWAGLGEQLLRELGSAGYLEFSIVDVEVSCETACDRAIERWWAGRTDSNNRLGGRFTPRKAITDLYPAGSNRSVCATNARAAFDHPLAAVIDSMSLFVDDYTGGSHVEYTTTRHKGIVNYASGPGE